MEHFLEGRDLLHRAVREAEQLPMSDRAFMAWCVDQLDDDTIDHLTRYSSWRPQRSEHELEDVGYYFPQRPEDDEAEHEAEYDDGNQPDHVQLCGCDPHECECEHDRDGAGHHRYGHEEEYEHGDEDYQNGYEEDEYGDEYSQYDGAEDADEHSQYDGAEDADDEPEYGRKDDGYEEALYRPEDEDEQAPNRWQYRREDDSGDQEYGDEEHYDGAENYEEYEEYEDDDEQYDDEEDQGHGDADD